jgi:signal transduction histidine kinase
LLLALFLLATRRGATNTLDWMSGWGRTTGFHAAVFLSLTLIAVVWQYRTNRVGVNRRQIRWLVLAVLVVGGSALLFYFLPPLIGGRGVDSNIIGLIGLLFPLAVAIAILRHNLFDIDTLLNRTLVYGALTAGTMGLYVFIVGYMGSLLQARDRSLIAFLTTGLVAVLFQPLRERLQRGVNRLMYGEWDDPYAVLSRLGRRLEATLSPATTLPTVVETVAQALKLRYVALALQQDDELEIVASYGLPDEEPIRLPLTFQSAAIGQLILAPRTPGEPLAPAEERLLADIAGQAGVAAQAVRLTNDLRRLAEDLQHSRERLVTAREEERRRLRRDLHDGLGPQLASLTLKLDAARNLLEDNPGAADALLIELKTQTQTAIADIRRLVYDLRPPALDELGLVGALREHAAAHSSTNGLKVSIEAPPALPVLPAAAEVAAYRIALEALTNVARHARAQECVVRLTLDDELQLEISDDGMGLPEMGKRGIGLTSMQERAAELGGKCVVTTRPTGGTQVLAQLPLNQET